MTSLFQSNISPEKEQKNFKPNVTSSSNSSDKIESAKIANDSSDNNVGLEDSGRYTQQSNRVQSEDSKKIGGYDSNMNSFTFVMQLNWRKRYLLFMISIATFLVSASISVLVPIYPHEVFLCY